MANQAHLDLLKQGTSVWNHWRTQNRKVLPDLSGANLAAANLSEAMLFGADLSGANLMGAKLNGASLNKAILRKAILRKAGLVDASLAAADLSGADLSGANIGFAYLVNANLSGANLSGANLSAVNLREANLSGANLSGANTWHTIFVDIDLSTVQGLTAVQHIGPSSIGIDTIYRSQGKIPEVFLRDAGVPGSFLEYMHSLVGQPIRYFTCFISHSHHDQHFCDRLYADLRQHDVPSWYFPEDATWGKTVWGEIDHSIKIYDKLVVVCSEHSLQSGPVLREIERALQREDREGKNILFPLRLDNYLFQEWEHERKADVINKIAGNFRGWESSAEKYDKAFQRFLKALKAEEKSTT